jgi:hypothetical protein
MLRHFTCQIFSKLWLVTLSLHRADGDLCLLWHGDAAWTFVRQKNLLSCNAIVAEAKRKCCMSDGIFAFYPRFSGFWYLVLGTVGRVFSTRGAGALMVSPALKNRQFRPLKMTPGAV